MSVKQKEMGAVLSYLKMEIGWYYYNIKYTKDDEQQIEKSRKVKETKKVPKVPENDPIKVLLVSEEPKKQIGGSLIVASIGMNVQPSAVVSKPLTLEPTVNKPVMKVDDMTEKKEALRKEFTAGSVMIFSFLKSRCT